MCCNSGLNILIVLIVLVHQMFDLQGRPIFLEY